MAGMGQCTEYVEKPCGCCDNCAAVTTVRCPRQAVGRFVVRDGYENRSYPMCAEHGAMAKRMER